MKVFKFIMSISFWDRLSMVRVATEYVKKYRPEQYGLYWWPLKDRATRIDVLNKCIVDALNNND